MTEPSSLEPSIALAAYAEPLASNRRVLVFGNALAPLPLQLLERGARSVHVCDRDPLRASEAKARNRSTQISFSSLSESDLALQDGAFDLALIDDLSAFDATSVVRTAKRAVGARGVTVAACPNSEASFPLLRLKNSGATRLDYYALYDVVAAEFEYVRMLGQTPFVGYAIADFSASGEPEPALDTSFVPGGAEEPDWFIALGSDREVRLDEFAVIQLPTRRLLGSLAVPEPVRPSESSAESKARTSELTRLNQWIKELESRASTADERADHSETELEELRPKLEAERAARATLQAEHEKELTALRAGLSQLQTRASALQAEADTLRAEASTLRTELEAVRAGSEELQRAAHSERAVRASSDEELSRLKTESSRLSAELSARDQQLAEQIQKLEQASASEIAEFERQLLDRGAELRKLEQDLRTAERTGRELARELDRRRSDGFAAANAELERALAEREADLQAAAWTIESLSLRLELASKPSSDDRVPSETALPTGEAR